MSKFAKGSLITAGVFLAIGFILCLISVIFGGKKILTDEEFVNSGIARVEEVMGRFNIDPTSSRWIFGWDFYDPDYDYEDDFFESDDDFDFDDSYDDTQYSDENGESITELFINGENISAKEQKGQISAADVKSLDLDLGAGTFEIDEKASDDNTIEIYIKGVGRCNYQVEDTVLHLEGFKGIHTLHTHNGKNTIKLKLPKGFELENITANVGAGEMDISSLKSKKLEVNLGAGTLDLEKIESDELTAIIGAGSMDADDMQIKNANLSVNLGECNFKGSIEGDLDAECDMGSLQMHLDGSKKDHNYTISCAAGTITMDGFSAAALSADKVIDNGADSDFNLTCNMGTVTVKFKD